MDFLIDPYRFKATLKLTSQLYPPIVVDGADITADLVGGLLIIWPIEELLLTNDLTAGLLTVTVIYSTYGHWPPESADITADFTAGELIVVGSATYTTYTMRQEGTDITADLTDGEVIIILITYDNWPAESADITADFTAGTLT